MSTHRHFDRICCVVLVLTLLFTVLFVCAEDLGIKRASSASGYETRLFDSSSVHTIDIVIDKWDEFLASCKNEEYYSCAVVIDNEAYKNVAIRAKGNTSLTQVEAFGNSRYSFKIEFDHYDSSKSYYGLDKLCLNNIIQDNTYMKDYLTYQMMAQMGVASPLCSYVNITVNGESWGLYLAVEGVEEAFLQRNYGNDYGELYKPDSTAMGGGRGNGEKFDTDGFGSGTQSESSDSANDQAEQAQPPDQGPDNMPQSNPNGSVQMPDRAPGGRQPDGSMPGTMQDGTPPELPDGKSPFDPGAGEMPDSMTPPDDNDRTQDDGNAPDSTPEGNIPDGIMPGGGMFGDMSGEGIPDKMPGGKMGSDDVLLKYIDDDPDSYSNIFDNAKTDISSSDKKRLIESLQRLSNGENLSSTVDIEAVIRYFAVHNFVLNFDSYTGSMIHNYYLYEKNGQMQMIPWDYNLAFGGFESSAGATKLVNYPIDSPVSGGNTEDRPMLAWIFANGEYTELYHRCLSEFISAWFENGRFENMIDSVSAMISPYVEKDPTKFCTYEEFEAGVSTLKKFCLLHAESIEGQLNGSIGSTSDTQQSGELIDAGDLQISDMGSMNNFMGGGMPNKQWQTDDNGFGQMPRGDVPNGQNEDFRKDFPPEITGEKPDANGVPGEIGQKSSSGQSADSMKAFIWTAVSVSILAVGVAFALLFRRRKG